jgi:hypothetical protein
MLELSQLCYKGVFRTIALGSTHGLSTHSCTFVLSLSPLIVPVGRIALGRILNVLGSSIDRYMELSLSTELFSYHLISSVRVQSHKKLGTGLLESYPVVYPYHIIPITLTSLSSIVSWNRMIINTNLFADASNWIFYLAYSWEEIISASVIRVQSIKVSHVPLTMSLLAFQEAVEYRFYYTDLMIFYRNLCETDTLFALVKPIHKTPLPMITLTISVNLFETGIKVVDLFSTY